MIIDIYLNDYKQILQTSNKIGKTFENKSTILKFHLLDNAIDKSLYLDVEKPDGSKFKSSALTIVNNIAEYEIVNSLLDQTGILKVEAILQNNNSYVLKYPTLEFEIIEAINAVQSIEEEQPDFVSECQAVIDLIDTTGDGNSYLSNDGTYKPVSSGSNDYNLLTNKPMTNSTSMDYENPIVLRDLQSGIYNMIGYIVPFSGSQDIFAAQTPIQVNVCRAEDMSWVQLFFAYNNIMQYFEIANDSYTYKEIHFNDFAS